MKDLIKNKNFIVFKENLLCGYLLVKPIYADGIIVDFVVIDTNLKFIELIKEERKNIIGEKLSQFDITREYIDTFITVYSLKGSILVEAYIEKLDQAFIIKASKTECDLLILSFDDIESAKAELKKYENRLFVSQKMSKTGNWELDFNSMSIWASKGAFEIYGIERKSSVLPLDLVQKSRHPEDSFVDEAIPNLLNKGIPYDVKFRIYRISDGELRYIHSIAKLEYDEFSKPSKLIGVTKDITDQVKINEELKSKISVIEKNEKKISELAYFDVLTGLPNKNYLYNNINSILEKNKMFFIIMLNIDNFKYINDTFGHLTGDKLLVIISKRLNKFVLKNDMLTRFNGDEFVYIISDKKTKEEIKELIVKISSKLSEVVFLENNRFYLTCSFGVSVFSENSINFEELLMYADSAMQISKKIGKNKYKFFDMNMKKELVRRMNIEASINIALEKNEFYMCYQPQFYTKESKRLRGFEALLRWKNSEKENVSTFELITIAEEIGKIIDIGRFVIESTIKFYKKLGKKELIASINASPIELKETDYCDFLTSIVKKYDVNPRSVEIEITESIFLENNGQALLTIENLRRSGFRIALDDFGTGYSSLSSIMNFNIDEVKIDKTFIDNYENRFIEGVLIFFDELGIESVVEGVETKKQLEFLKNTKSNCVQGYCFEKPLIERKFIEFCKKNE
ncbi:bifunctional diguanylate cyclase/phosphodiesterase [Helicovermis profundi]|uniref:Uncharacterized protein n=1 Tax=Helicovermis profundi TaxID=3065157 RepID=A0AAU9E6Q3_9FIRM|nr:hypothetical protein HLPR_21360 [Clostridia bacterium S502]